MLRQLIRDLVSVGRVTLIVGHAVPLTRDYLTGEETRIARPAAMNGAKAGSC